MEKINGIILNNNRNGIQFPFLLFFVIIFIFSNLSCNKKVQKKELLVLCFHTVNPNIESFPNVKPNQLEKIIMNLKLNNYNFVSSMIQFYRSNKNKNVILTFDDGWKSQYLWAINLLNKYKIKALFFIYPTVIDRFDKYMNWEMIKSIKNQGHEIGIHSYNHPDLTKHRQNYNSFLKKQIIESKNIIENKLNYKIHNFAYPFGLYNKKIQKFLYSGNYRYAFTTNNSKNDLETYPYYINRFVVNKHTNIRDIINCKILKLKYLYPENGKTYKKEIDIIKGELTNNIPYIDIYLMNNWIGRVKVQNKKFKIKYNLQKNKKYQINLIYKNYFYSNLFTIR